MIKDQLQCEVAIVALADHEADDVDCRVIHGQRDMTGCDAIRAFFLRCDRTIRRGAGRLVIDLGRVHLADTKLMACLVAVFQMARAASVRLELRASQAVLDMIEFCKLRWLIEHDASER